MGKPLTLMLSLSLLTPFLFVPKVLALVDIKTTGSSSEVHVQQNVNSSNSTYVNSSSNTGGISVSQSGGDNNSVKIINNRFTVSGKVTEKSDDHINLSGQKIVIDKSKVSNFSQTGDTSIGQQVTAEGPVINGTLYAEKIYGGTPSATSTPTNTPNPTNSPSPSPTPNPTNIVIITPNPSIAGEATVSGDIKKMNQSIIAIIETILAHIINSLKLDFNR